MKDKTLVSIVAPAFSSERFLEMCLASVKGQSSPNIEVIVVDNHSTDACCHVHIAKIRHCALKQIRHIDDNMTNLGSTEPTISMPLISIIIPTKNRKWHKRNAHQRTLHDLSFNWLI